MCKTNMVNFLAIFLKQLLSTWKHNFGLKNQDLPLIFKFLVWNFLTYNAHHVCVGFFSLILFREHWAEGRVSKWHRLCSKIYQSAWHQKGEKKNQNQNSPVLRITTYLVLYTTPPNIVTEMLYQAFTQSKFGSSVQGVWNHLSLHICAGISWSRSRSLKEDTGILPKKK